MTGKAMPKYADNSTKNPSLREMASRGLEHQFGDSYTVRQGIDHANPNEWDQVNKPAHYNNGGENGIEAIDYIKQQLGEGFKGYLEGNVLKYIHRHKYKGNPKQDLEKAKWYLDRLINEIS